MSLLTEGIWIALGWFQQISGPYFEGGLQLPISPYIIWSTTQKEGGRGGTGHYTPIWNSKAEPALSEHILIHTHTHTHAHKSVSNNETKELKY
jgi:hypothetical protein